jgi:hypothetical protein
MRRPLLLTCLLLTCLLLPACDDDVTLTAQDRVVDGFSYVDAGAIAMGETSVFTVPLFSKAGKVRIFEIMTEDISVPEAATGSAFQVDDAAWAKDCDGDDDGTADCLDLDAYSDSSDTDTLPLGVVFAPTARGYYEGLLTVWSNDNTSTELAPLPDDETQEWTIWRVQLRGLSDYACGRAYPNVIDFGKRPIDGDFSATVTLANCGIVPLKITDILASSPAMESRTLPPVTVLPGRSEPVVVGWTVASNDPDDGVLTFTSNSEQLATVAIDLIGNDCERSLNAADWDKDGDDWSKCGGDCDDDRADDNPSRNELVDDGHDNDCDGVVDETEDDTVGDDADGDGCAENGDGATCDGGMDCNDNDPNIGPHAREVYNQIDDDCDGVIDEDTEAYDDDQDGWSELEGDCDDSEAAVNFEATEVVDGRDNDCDGVLDEGGVTFDDDADGYADVEPDGRRDLDDCDDRDPWAFAGAREYCDGYDNDCDGVIDEGEDDEPDGACAFRPTRSAAGTDAEGNGAAPGKQGCATGAGAVAGPVLLLALALVPRRRRD